MKRQLTAVIFAGLMAAGAIAGLASAQGPGRMMPGMGIGYGMMGSGCPGYGYGPGGMGPGRGFMHGGPGMMFSWNYDAEKAGELLDERLDELRNELAIGEKQEKAWKAYTEAAKDRFATMQGMHQAMHKAMFEGDAIERMEFRVSIMENMLDSMKAMLPAVKALYATLPDAKKKSADVLLGGCEMM